MISWTIFYWCNGTTPFGIVVLSLSLQSFIRCPLLACKLFAHEREILHKGVYKKSSKCKQPLNGIIKSSKNNLLVC